MTQQVQELKRVVEWYVKNDIHERPVRMDEFIDRLRREISKVRRENPSLEEYHLHDMTMSFQSHDIILHFDFRKW